MEVGRQERESEWLASFLQELDGLEEPLDTLELLFSSSGGYDSGDDSSASPDVFQSSRAKRNAVTPAPGDRAIATRYRRLKHNDRVKKLRSEIHSLLTRLQPDPTASGRSSRKTNWKQRVTCERYARDCAQFENVCLKQRLAQGLKLQDDVARLLLKQQELMPKKLFQVQFSLKDDDAHVFRLLKADLFKRQLQLELSMRSRLDEITQQSLRGSFIQAEDRWDVDKHNEDLRMDVQESVLLPFKAAALSSAISQYTQSGSIQVVGDSIVDRVVRGVMANDVEQSFALDHISSGRQLEGRSILRRIRNEYGLVLLWESMSYWQIEDARDESPHAIVHESGWSIISPVSDALSVCYFEKGFRISSSDGSPMKKRDPIVRTIVKTCQEFHHLQSRRTENMIIDRSIAVETQQSSRMLPGL